MRSWREEPLEIAWRKVFRSPEGQLLRASLSLVVAEIGPLESGALQAHLGRRSFAAELLRLGGYDALGGELPPAPEPAGPQRQHNRRTAAEPPRE